MAGQLLPLFFYYCIPTEQPAPKTSWAATRPACFNTSELKQSWAELHLAFSLETREQTQETWPCGASGICFAHPLPKQAEICDLRGLVSPPPPTLDLKHLSKLPSKMFFLVMAMTSLFISIYKNNIILVLN